MHFLKRLIFEIIYTLLPLMASDGGRWLTQLPYGGVLLKIISENLTQPLLLFSTAGMYLVVIAIVLTRAQSFLQNYRQIKNAKIRNATIRDGSVDPAKINARRAKMLEATQRRLDGNTPVPQPSSFLGTVKNAASSVGKRVFGFLRNRYDDLCILVDDTV